MSEGFFWASRQRGRSEGVFKLATAGRLRETRGKGKSAWRPAGYSFTCTIILGLGLTFPVRCFSQCCPPVITAQPQSQTVTQGVNATFSVAVSSGTFLTYQWRFNGNN